MNPLEVNVFSEFESNVRSYCRQFSTVFARARGSCLYNEAGEEYIDFLCGAGSLNYGHNNSIIKKGVIDYLNNDGVLLSLDLHSKAKKEFIQTFHNTILAPRNLDYKLQFTSPTGTSVVESAIKLARKFTGRQNIVAFTNAFHGMSGVSLSLTGNRANRQAIPNSLVTRFPFDGYLGPEVDSVAYYRKLLEDNSSGIDLPAAVILETVQGEGGLNVASEPWLRELRALTQELGILLIVDDIQAGCGRSGYFFSFERASIEPDMVCLSKSIGGMGFPFAVLLLNPELDVWSAGEDNGTFRGNNLAFVASTIMLNHYWSGRAFEQEVQQKAHWVRRHLENLQHQYPAHIKSIRGLGLMQGIEFAEPECTDEIIQLCFENNLVVESCGPQRQVLKLMPALTIETDVLTKGLQVISRAVNTCLGPQTTPRKGEPFSVNACV